MSMKYTTTNSVWKNALVRVDSDVELSCGATWDMGAYSWTELSFPANIIHLYETHSFA